MTSRSVPYHLHLQCNKNETHKQQHININLIYTDRCCRSLSTCLPMSANLICVRRWIWDEFISTGWESGPHILGLLGSSELYPYFPWGGSQWNPAWSMEAVNEVVIEECCICRDCWEHTHHKQTPLQTQVRVLTVTCVSQCYLLLW